MGWLVWEIMTGKIPFKLAKARGIPFRIMKGDLEHPEKEESISHIGGLADLIRSCWKMEPDARIQIGPFVQVIEELISSLEEVVSTPA